MTPPHAGTDATHADHIETIKTRNYVGVEPNGGFVPGELGMGLVEGKKKHCEGISKSALLSKTCMLDNNFETKNLVSQLPGE